MHRDKAEDCMITYTNGETYIHKFFLREKCDESGIFQEDGLY